jgi:hypothetical protein
MTQTDDQSEIEVKLKSSVASKAQEQSKANKNTG